MRRPSPWIPWAVLGVVLSCLGPPVARGAPVRSLDERLVRVRLCVSVRDARCARDELMRALSAQSGASPEQERELWVLKAEVALLTASPTAVAQALDALVAEVPEFGVQERKWPVEWQQALAEALARRPDTSPPELQVDQGQRCQEGISCQWTVQAKDPHGVERVILVVSPGDGLPVLRLRFRRAQDEAWRVEIPAEILSSAELKVRVEAWDLLGNGPSGWPSGERNHSLAVSPAPVIAPPEVVDAPLWEQWWLWTLVGAGVAGLAVGIYFLAVPEESPSTATSTEPGGLQVDFRWPDQ